MKRILITGANSYIGTSFEKYIYENYPDEYQIDTLDMMDPNWKEYDFNGYDSIFHVAGIAHQKETRGNRDLYYKVNRDLAIEVALKAKNAKVNQFILMSSMSVYGLTQGYITKDSKACPNNAYGKSKLQADEMIYKMNSENFHVVILRPPMIYGSGCKGNYQILRNFVLKFHIFPGIKNQRSMIYVDNLSYFVKKIIDNNFNGIFFPQNKEYVSTDEIVYLIAKNNNIPLIIINIFNFFIKNISIKIFQKVFGNLIYEKVDLVEKYDFVESIKLTETKMKI
ncbi:MAG: NAD-dependent epimerase/dehydratase family protein [Thomasclavelia sp.]|nr:NAD-dependent epimerase/dehydratase family protein [Thomasclavelia sp.]